jgi:hypothetical protein
MLTVYNDITNTFGFAGANGYGPGRHRQHEFLSSHQFGIIANATAKLGWLSGYNFYSSEGHISCFYGNIVFRSIDGTMSAFLDSTTANYGINLEYDTPDATSIADIFNTDTSNFEIPLNDDLIFEAFDPFIRLSPIYDSTTLYQYRPIFDGYAFTNTKYVNVYLYDCFLGKKFTVSDYTSLGDRDLRIQLFGFRHIAKEDL